jgi:prevent-host-death family protein
MMTITSSDLRRRLREVLSDLKRAAEPYFVMQYSRPVAVLLDIKDYEALQSHAQDPHPRIVRRPGVSGGDPVIDGTRIPVWEIVERVRAGQTPEDIAEGLPPLTPALVHDALSYYFDHRAEIDQEIADADPLKVLERAGLEPVRVAPGIVFARRRSPPAP